MDPLTILAGGSALAGIGSSIYNTYQQADANKWQKSAQKTTWAREDTAVQRRVADLKASGLSPVLAAGSSAGTSAPVKLTPPQSEGLDKGIIAMSAYMDILQKKEDIAKTEQQTDLILLQQQSEQEKIKLMQDINPLKVQEKQIAVDYASLANPQKLKQMALDIEKTGIQNTTARIDQDIKRLGVTRAELLNTAQQLSNSLAEVGIKGAKKDLLIKEVTIRIKEQELKTARHNINIYEALGLPTNQSMTDLMKGGTVLGNALGNIFK